MAMRQPDIFAGALTFVGAPLDSWLKLREQSSRMARIRHVPRIGQPLDSEMLLCWNSTKLRPSDLNSARQKLQNEKHINPAGVATSCLVALTDRCVRAAVMVMVRE